ncbi:YjeO family protein [Enterobacter sp.]|uniref:YjeO family protein n=1 Tax=Enterobacter sp. TaxID=42895 RepID=UPI00296E2826|nr:YjeO family protein [Enterobacter sp.]
MNWKSLTCNIIWLLFSFFLMLIFSTQDKESMIDGREINTICDVMIYFEDDDIRSIGMMLTIPLFFPLIYAILWKKQRNIWQYLVFIILLSFWLWRFIIRYQVC